MINNLFQFTIKTDYSEQFINITHLVKNAVSESGVKDGIVTLFCPHTTAGITINENTDPDVVRDILTTLDRVFPVNGDYRHIEENSHAHIKASYMGSSCSVIVNEGELLLGTWQGIYFCEFDGPRNRKLYVKVLSETS